MTQIHLDFEYHFQNVGQGLFGFGRVNVRSPVTPEPQLRWVFDCGTASREDLITSGLSRLEGYFGAGSRIDLVAISHFDKDHISGMCELLTQFQVDALMLPYVAREIRLRIAAAQKVKRRHPLFGFYDNPVRFLRALPRAAISRIVFVLPGGPPPPRGPKDKRRPANLEPVGGLVIPDGPPVPEAVLAAPSDNGPTVQTVMSGESLTFRDVWEFVPYNDMKVPLRVGGPRGFAADVMAVRDELQGVRGDKEKDDALRRLKWIYDDAFGRGSRRRNEISLHLYGGPIGVAASELRATIGARYVRDGKTLQPQRMARLRCRSCASGVLYTGDGYLSTNQRVKRMIACLTDSRIGRVGVFQVMHHGAEGNWRKGVADRIAPDFSVFSSDPRHKKFGHPHAAVVKDFLPYSPLQVDDRRYASFHGAAWM